MYVQAISSLMTIRDLLRFAVTCFNRADLAYGHGTNNAYDEAVYLILAQLDLPIEDLASFMDAKLLPVEIEAIISLIRRRVEERVPVAYLTNKAWQGGFEFYVDERALVPRSFIYELLGEPLQPWIPDSLCVERALDLCTGSGCLAIQLAYHYSQAHIDAVDISLDALEVAAINVQKHQLEGRIQLIHTDLFEGLDTPYDLIVTNPPYVNGESVRTLPAEYLHEPELALGSGEDGLEATRAILQGAADLLTPSGILLVEIGHNQDALEQAFPNLPFVWLETESGNGFVFLLTRQDLLDGLRN